MKRRSFIRNTGMAAVVFRLKPGMDLQPKNKLPKWKGFNLLDFFSPDPANSRPQATEDQFKWMRDWGFDFVRIPIAYPSYLNIDRTRNITPEETYKLDERAIERIDKLISLAHKYEMHVSINLH